MQRTRSSAAVSHQPRLPPGFKFHPTDEELVVHYLQKQAASAPLPAAIIAEIDLYKYDPWELPSKASFGEQEWYFFSPRERKYPNGERPNRAATSGYWKATGTDKPILTGNGTQKIGVKKALVFYGGKPPKGIKTNWIMHEYRLVDSNSTTNKPPGINPTKKNSSRLDDWVLCRIFKKSNSSNMEENTSSSISRAADIGYEINQIPGPGRNWNLFSGAAGNGSAINTSANPTSISPVLAAPPAMFSTNNQWEAAAADDDDDKNTCFISLLNDQQQQQYPQTIFHQNPSLIVLNNYSTEEGDGIPNQSYQHPNSYFQ